MGARKKKPKDESSFTVVLEDLRSQFKVFAEALQGLEEKVDRGFAAVDARFAAVDARFGQIDARFERNEAAVLENSREIRDVRSAVARIEVAMEKKVDRDEVEAIVARVIAR